MKIVATKYYFSQKDIDFIFARFRQIIKTGQFLTLGKYCKEFEDKFAHYIGTKYAISTNSGTSALEGIFSALDVGGYDVIVPTNTFAATVFAIIKAGGNPIFVDVLDDLTIDPEEVKRKLTPKTKVVVTVHIGGLISPKTKELLNFCKKKKIYFVEDAAQAHGSMLDGKKAGKWGIAAAFSFFPTKLMTTGEGGMVVTDNRKIANRIRLLRNQAKVDNRNYHKIIGDNWRLSEIQALMGISQLKNLEKFIERRNFLASIYNFNLKDVLGIKLLTVPENVRHNYYKYIVFLSEEINREKLEKELKSKFGISLSGCVYDIPCHKQPVFKKYYMGKLPNAERLAKCHIALPIYYEMSPREAKYVADSLRACLRRYL